MPKYIEIYEIDYFKLCYPQTKVDPSLKGFLSISYPGMFIAVGESRDEALQICKLRLRHSYLKHTKDWSAWSKHREKMIGELLIKTGVTAEHVWEECDIGRIE